MESAAAHKIGTRDTVIVSSELNLSAALIEVEDGQIVRVLVGNEQVLTTVVKFEMTRSLSASMKIPYSRELALVRPTLLDLQDGDGLVPTVGYQDKASALVEA